MSSSISGREPVFQFPRSQAVEHNTIDRSRYDALAAELKAARDLSQRQVMLAREFEHRITNALQLIAGLLSLQSRTMQTPEARIGLSIAARRIVALGTVHHRLHPLDQKANVELKEFLIGLCDDLSDLLFQNRTDRAITVEGAEIEVPSSLAGPLGLIANELITNSVKHATGNITVRLEKSTPATYSLSVLDDGPGLPAGDEPTEGKGLGMKLVRELIKQIGGDVQTTPRDDRKRACLIVTFCR
jgi:two-component system, sensor histidine kinase PdtaS